jgi:hypothetical protein
VLRELGRGGMGVVFEVQDPNLPRTLALKLLLKRKASESSLERFLREARVLTKVEHGGVVRVHDLGESPEGPYLVMAKVTGESLAERLARGGPLRPREAAELVAALAEAVEAVHAAGVLHRDLKPANVMLRPSGAPVLLDFGVARDEEAERLTRTGTTLGTPSYMSPEQARGESSASLGPATDVYALGVLLYEVLTGRPPFEGPPLTVLGAILSMDPEPPSRVRPGIPKALDAICLRALRKNPAKRPPSAAALGEDLTRFLAGGGGPGGGWVKPALVGLTTRALVVLATLAGLLAPGGAEAEPTGGAAIEEPSPAAVAAKRARERRAGERALVGVRRLPDATKRLAAAQAWLTNYPEHPLRAEAEALVRDLRTNHPLVTFTLHGDDANGDAEDEAGDEPPEVPERPLLVHFLGDGALAVVSWRQRPGRVEVWQVDPDASPPTASRIRVDALSEQALNRLEPIAGHPSYLVHGHRAGVHWAANDGSWQRPIRLANGTPVGVAPRRAPNNVHDVVAAWPTRPGLLLLVSTSLMTGAKLYRVNEDGVATPLPEVPWPRDARVRGAAFPNEDHLVVWGKLAREGLLHSYRLTDRSLLFERRHPHPFSYGVVASDGSLLVYDEARIFVGPSDVDAFEQLTDPAVAAQSGAFAQGLSVRGIPTGLAFGPRALRLYTANRKAEREVTLLEDLKDELRIWSRSGDVLRRWEPGVEPHTISVSPSGVLLAVGSVHGQVQVWLVDPS